DLQPDRGCVDLKLGPRKIVTLTRLAMPASLVATAVMVWTPSAPVTCTGAVNDTTVLCGSGRGFSVASTAGPASIWTGTESIMNGFAPPRSAARPVTVSGCPALTEVPSGGY